MPAQSLSISLADVPLFHGIPAAELRHIQACLIEKKVPKGQILFIEGDQCSRILIVKSGRVKIFKMAGGEREQILEILNPGDSCACNPGSQTWSCASSAQALTESVVWSLSREQYIQLVRNNTQLSRSLANLLAKRLCHFGCLIEQVSLKDTQKRLARFILDMHENSVAQRRAHNVIAIPFTREEIAQRLGSTRETVTRHLNYFKKTGLIGIQPKEILVLDVDGLQKAAV